MQYLSLKRDRAALRQLPVGAGGGRRARRSVGAAVGRCRQRTAAAAGLDQRHLGQQPDPRRGVHGVAPRRSARPRRRAILL